MLDAGLVAHLGVIIDGWPMVIPTCYGFNVLTITKFPSQGPATIR